MNGNRHLEGLRKKLTKVAAGDDLESLARDRAPRARTESVLAAAAFAEGAHAAPGRRAEVEATALRKLQNGDFDDVSPVERLVIEAVVEEEGRPVAFILNDRFEPLPDPWKDFNKTKSRKTIQAAIPSIGRVEIPAAFPGDVPIHVGTGFVVGDGLLMTNRHVAERFVRGVGRQRLTFLPGSSSAVDFRRERGFEPSDASASVTITGVAMVHPFWDMALMRVEDLPATAPSLMLSVAAPEDLLDEEIAVIGYPARNQDPSAKAIELERKHFGSEFGVKRLAPGEIREREIVESFGHLVSAMTHDSSTLPGNSGSALLSVASGEIVGLHFAGITLHANYSVPTFELARDSRVVDAGVQFAGTITETDHWENYWRAVESETVTPPSPSKPTRREPPAKPTDPPQPNVVASWTIPITIDVDLGEGVSGAAPLSPTDDDRVTTPGVEASFQIPIIHPDLESRVGYDPDFLADLSGEDVPLPKLTAKGKRAVAKLEDGTFELKYHRFSVVMHKKRRLALFTAANVSWRPADRLIDGHDPTRAELTGIPEGVQEEWVLDERLPAKSQLPDLFFTRDGGSFDKGHLVRRDDVAWGDSFDAMQKGNGDTYHVTNCSPQVLGFNRSNRGKDNWGELENLVQSRTKAERVCVFSGPVLSKYDRIFKGLDESGPVKIQIPTKFWKIVVARSPTEGLQAFGFVLEQDLDAVPLEFAVPPAWKIFQKPIAEIEALTFGLVSFDWFEERDAFED